MGFALKLPGSRSRSGSKVKVVVCFEEPVGGSNAMQFIQIAPNL